MMEATSPQEACAAAGERPLAAAWARAWETLAHGRWAMYVVYLGAAWLVTGLYWELTEQLDTATIEKFVAGEANKPFAYRVLMPVVMALVAGLNNIDDLKMVDVPLRVMVLFGTMLVLRRWLRHFVHPLLADVSPLLLGVILPWSFHFYWPYDFSGILLWTACLLCLVERRYPIYILLFTLATFNRETTFFLIGIFAATQWEALGWRRTLRYAGAQAGIWAAIFVSLRLVIRPDAGDPVEVHFLENLLWLAQGYGFGPFEHWMRLLSGLGFFWLLAPWYWSKKSEFLKRACWILPFYIFVMLAVARLVETRLWYEWAPIVLALAGQSLMEFGRREQGRAALGEAPG
jgi:hypothetical protein